MKKLLLLSREQAEFSARVRALGLEGIEIFAPETEAEIFQVLGDIEIFLANPPLAAKYVNLAPKLKWMQSTFAGIDLLVSPELRKDYILTNVKDTYGVVMSEYVLAYILMFEKKLRENLAWQSEKLWAQQAYVPIAGKTLGLIGTGSIGSHLAQVAKAFQLSVLGFDTSGKSKPGFDEVHEFESGFKHFSRCDYLVSILPSTSSTRGLLNKRFFAGLKSSCIFINVGRGDTVDEQDLLAALREESLRAAVLDVFVKEPLPPEHAFWTEPRVVLTPHVSGYCLSERIFEIFADNYKRYLQGEELLYQVDFTKGY